MINSKGRTPFRIGTPAGRLQIDESIAWHGERYVLEKKNKRRKERFESASICTSRRETQNPPRTLLGMTCCAPLVLWVMWREERPPSIPWSWLGFGDLIKITLDRFGKKEETKLPRSTWNGSTFTRASGSCVGYLGRYFVQQPQDGTACNSNLSWEYPKSSVSYTTKINIFYFYFILFS